MNVLIVGKTFMHARQEVCIGGLDLESNKSLRLLQPSGSNHLVNVEYELGQIWELDIRPRPSITPPHVEDVLVLQKRFIEEQAELKNFVMARVPIWKNHPINLFDRKIQFTSNGSGYVSKRIGLSNVSTGYWISDQVLTRKDQEGKVRYHYMGGPLLTYVGVAEPVDVIPKGALIRVSLARWWKPPDTAELEERCYLQLSGWFL